MHITFRSGEFVAAGNTYPHREALKAAGFRWDPARRIWHTTALHNVEPIVRWLDDAATARIAELEQRINESRASAADIDVPVPAGLTPYPFQLAGVKYALHTLAEGRGVLIADEMGLGKTVQAILVANTLRPRRVVVVCPASVKLNWVYEWKRWSTLPLTVGVIAGNNMPDADVLIVNYDVASRHVERLACDLLIVDEAHYIKNERSQRARAVKI
jgi:SNF2 family DNA or RNA helicase